MAAYAVNQEYKRIVVYHNGTQSQEELCTAFELALQDTGSKVVDYVPSIASESEFDGIYDRWKALEADCAVITQYGLDRAFEVLGMIRAKDRNFPVLGEPIFNRANALEVHKEISEGMVIPSTLVIEKSEKLRQFGERYRQRFGKDMDIWSVQGYDMLRMIVDTAVRLDSNDPQQIASALHDQQGYQGIGRHIAFTEGGAMITDVSKLPILTCRNSVFE
jgi:branched-chain amino acid transport system substrate-binding protein